MNVLNRDDLQNVLDDIYHSLLKVNTDEEDSVGLFGGLSGLALFYFYYGRYRKNEAASEKAVQILDRIFDLISEGDIISTFSNGIAGLSWLIAHLKKEKFIETDDDDNGLKQLDPYLYSCMKEFMLHGNYDFLHGAGGIVFYFLTQDEAIYTDYIIEFTDLLDKKAIRKNGSIKWLSTLILDSGLKGYNLGLAHGIPSMMKLLSLIYKSKIQNNKITELLKGTIKFLFDHQLDRGVFDSYFPNWIAKDEKVTSSRLAWCYGDLGIGLSLISVAEVLNDKNIENFVLKVLTDTTNRKDMKQNHVNDACICHGTAGNAQIYSSIYRITKNKIFKKSKEYWLEQTVQMAKFEDGYGGFKYLSNTKNETWKNSYNLLNGSAGIGLAIISNLYENVPSWDECLLLS